MVEGVCHALDDQSQDSIQVSRHIARAQMNHAIPALGQVEFTPFIAHWAITKVVRGPVDFDHQTGVAHEEVRHVRADRMLPPHFETKLARAELTPERHLGRGHLAA
jgi:hypothetical protein